LTVNNLTHSDEISRIKFYQRSCCRCYFV